MNTPPPLYSKREKYSLALCSVAFIAFSGLVHTMVGSMGYGLMPHFTVQPTPSPQTIIIDSRPRPTPKPTPTPHVTPPPPPKVTPPVLPAVHPPTINPGASHGVGPTEPPYTPPTPGIVTASAPPATPIAQPSVAPTPNGPIAITDSTFKYRAPLEYPEIAIQQDIEGTAVVLVTIGADGTLISATIAESSGNANLDEAALNAARASRYTPYLANGVPTEQQYKIVYEFRLNQ
ncbi:MAG TPA: energy transducer TonB [Candidatus Eremiobacteraceae bacterium]